MGIPIILIAVIVAAKFLRPEWFVLDKSTRHNVKGLRHLGKYEFEKSKVEFKKAYKFETKSNEKKVMYLRNISLAYHELKEFESCYYYRNESLKYCVPDSYDYYVNKGDLAVLKGDIKSAIIYLEKAIAINPEKLEANNSLGLIYIGDYGEEYINLKKGLKHNIKANKILDDGITKNVLARTYYLQKDYRNSAKIFKEILEDNPNDLDSKFSLALIFYYQGKRELSKKLFKDLFKQDKNYTKGIEPIIEELKIDV